MIFVGETKFRLPGRRKQRFRPLGRNLFSSAPSDEIQLDFFIFTFFMALRIRRQPRQVKKFVRHFFTLPPHVSFLMSMEQIDTTLLPSFLFCSREQECRQHMLSICNHHTSDQSSIDLFHQPSAKKTCEGKVKNNARTFFT